MIRLFVAVAVPFETAEALAPLQEGVPEARWSPPENLHLTLRFIGEISEPAAEDLDAALGAVSSEAFAVRLAGVGFFDAPDGRITLWTGVQASPSLDRLRRRCDSAARRAGLAPDRRAWRPHVTLAYRRGGDPAAAARWIQRHNLVETPPFAVSSFGLYSSWRAGGGAVYRLERSYGLTRSGEPRFAGARR